MPFNREKIEVQFYDGEVIVNSLNEFGCVCEICEESFLIDSIDEFEVAEKIKLAQVSESIIIEKREFHKLQDIYHVLVPEHKDDPDNSKLLNLYRKILEIAVLNNMKTIAIPFLGIWGCGYCYRDVLKVINQVMTELDDYETEIDKDIISVTILSPITTNYYYGYADNYFLSYGYEDESGCEIIKRSFSTSEFEIQDCCAGPREKTNLLQIRDVEVNELMDCGIFMSEMNKKDYFSEKDKIFRYPFDFIDEYLKKFKDVNKAKKERLSGVLDRKKKSFFSTSKELSRKDVYLLGIAMGFNKTVFLEWMIVNGYSFSPMRELDMFVRDFIDGVYDLFDEDEREQETINERFWRFIVTCEEELDISLAFVKPKEDKNEK